jgi:hypothetical protein
MTATVRHVAPGEGQHDRDEGSVLVMCLILVMVCVMIVLPMLEFGASITRASRVARTKAVATEAVKGGLRTVLANPLSLYQACGSSSLSSPVSLGSPALGTTVTTSCAKVGEVAADDSGRYATASTMMGSVLPAQAERPYVASGQPPYTAWRDAVAATPTSATIWLPNLPAHLATVRQASGWTMPAEYGGCVVFFPGTYTAPVTVSGNAKAYFASGIYYFEQPVTISESVDVVMGGGAAEGCASDQEAAYDAIGAPTTHGISGLGVTFVFGDKGRLVLSASADTGAMRVRFNQRYVTASDVATKPSAGVSIMSVNGELQDGTLIDLDRPDLLSVPRSMAGTSPGVPAIEQSYRPSTLTAPVVVPTPAIPFTPIVEIDLGGQQSADIFIPGYVVTPQGRITIDTLLGRGANKSVRFNAGATAAMIALKGKYVAPTLPATLVIGIANPVVQKTFKVVSTSVGTSPQVTSTAIVQVNQNGAYAINSWMVQ